MKEHPTGVIRRTDHKVIIAVGALIVLTISLILYRLQRMDLDWSYFAPNRVYSLQIEQTFSGHGDTVSLASFLPETDDRQRILTEDNLSDGLQFQSYEEEGNRVGKWHAEELNGEMRVLYNARVRTSPMRYEIDPKIRIEDVQVSRENADVQPTEVIQSESEEIRSLAESLMPKNHRLLGYLKNIFGYVEKLGFKAFKGTTDALTAFRLGEASCNGKSRLLVALLRARRIPARLVGGLVMTVGTKRTSHQWVEVLVGGRWVPMDPTNHHFAEIPEYYLTVYRGDRVFFKHSADIGFKYEFSFQKKMVPPQEIDESKQVFGFFAVFKKMGIPLDFLKSIIMIPLGAVIVVIFRNVIGLRTFGTFLPVLIAVACRNTGIFWGLLGFTVIIAVVSLLRHLISKLQLLHSPQLGVLLTAVIGLLLGASALGATFDTISLAKMSLFPVVIIAITSERFAVMEIEEGRLAAWKILAESLAVVSVCYLVMNSLSLQILMLGFPELLFFVAALNIWIGRWVGLRASEWVRFKWFFNKELRMQGGAA